MSNPMTREHFFFQNKETILFIKKKEEKQQRSFFHRRTVSYTTTTAFSINLLLYLCRATSVLAFQKGRASGSFLSVKLDLCEVPKLCKFCEYRSKNKFFFHHLVRFCIFFNGLLLLTVLSLTLVYIFAA